MSYSVKQVVKTLSLLLLALTLFGCSTKSIPKLQNLEKYIDPEIQGDERAVMLQVLSALPDDLRGDVVHFTEDGKVYTNRIANKEGVQVFQKAEGTENLWENQAGYSKVFPSQRPRPNCNEGELNPLAPVKPPCGLEGSGVEFRIQTKAGVGNSANVILKLPSRAKKQILVDDPTGYRCNRDLTKDNPNTPAKEGLGETPYIYLGGWGSSGYKSRIDAGLQWNCGDGSDDWSLFFLREDIGITSDAFANRFAAGQDNLYLSFGVVDGDGNFQTKGDNMAVVSATGLNRTKTATQTKALTTRNVPGWFPQSPTDHILSISTSIAQDPNQGAGKYKASGSTLTGVEYYNLRVGATARMTTLWDDTDPSDPRYGGEPCKMPLSNVIYYNGAAGSTYNRTTVDLALR